MRPQTYITLLLILAFGLTQTLKAQTTADFLAGTWRFDYGTTLAGVDAETRTKYRDMFTPGSRLEAFYKGQKVTFYPDGAYGVAPANGMETLTRWELTGNDRTLRLIFSEDVVQVFSIIDLNATSLVLKPKANGRQKMFFPTFYYNRNN